MPEEPAPSCIICGRPLEYVLKVRQTEYFQCAEHGSFARPEDGRLRSYPLSDAARTPRDLETWRMMDLFRARIEGRIPKPSPPAQSRSAALRQSMTPEAQVGAVRAWQARGRPHAFACMYADHPLLEAVVEAHEFTRRPQVELRCRECGYKQDYIPEEALKYR